MPLIYEGDTTDNFGRFLPTPFIEKILIDDYGYELTFAIFLTIHDDQCVDEYKEWIDQEIYFNSLVMSNKPSTGWENLIKGKNVFDYYRSAQGSNSNTSDIILGQLDFKLDEDHVDEFYDSDGHRVLKFQANVGVDGYGVPPMTGGNQYGGGGGGGGGNGDPAADDSSCNEADGTERSVNDCCHNHGQCKSTNCVDGKCQQGDRANESDCQYGVQCESGFCCGGTCKRVTFNCTANEQSLYEAFDDRAEEGEDCTTNTDCKSGNCCEKNQMRSECIGSGEECVSTGMDDGTERITYNVGDTLTAVTAELYTKCNFTDATGATRQLHDCCNSNGQCTSDKCSGTDGVIGAADEYYEAYEGECEMSTMQAEPPTEMGDMWDVASGQYIAWTGVSTVWDEVSNFYIAAFGTTFDYNSATESEIEEKLANKQLFNREISGVSHERLFEDGIIADQLRTEFFAKNGKIYNGPILQSISSKYHKTTKVTHDEVVGFFTRLIDEFKSGDENGGPPLQKMINQISYVLEAYSEDSDLLIRLNTLRRAFPNKSGAHPLGKLYMRYSKRLSTLNKKLSASPEVTKKIIRNAKIFDMRSAPPLVYDPPTVYVGPDEKNDENYIYNTNYVGRTAMYSSRSGEQQTEASEGAAATSTAVFVSQNDPNLDGYDVIVRQFGYFFFDYEKALRNLSNVTQICDISKFIKYGIALPYDYFNITRVTLKRYSGAREVGSVYMYADMNEAYPITDVSIVDNQTEDSAYAIHSPGFYSDYESEQDAQVAVGVAEAAVNEEGNLVLKEEEYMYLMARNFEPVNKDGQITGITPNYRLMCFEFQDFLDDDIASRAMQPKEYTVTVEMQDNSIGMVTATVNKFTDSIGKLNSYYEKASEPFSYDEITGLFNGFFTDGITELYEGDLINAPWYRVPVLYNIHRDLIYNYFGGNVTDIIEDATNTINNINPINGSYYALEKFVEQVAEFYRITYVDGQIAYNINQLTDAGGYTFEIENKISYDSAGNSTADEESNMIYGTMYI